MNLKDKYFQYIKRAEDKLSPLAIHTCPKCHEIIKTLAAPKGEVWDSLCTCPFCESVFIKRVTEAKVETCLVYI